MSAGLLNARIALFAAAPAPDGLGGASPIYLERGETWASVTRLSSVPDVAGDRSVRLSRIAATIRTRSDLSTGDRVRFDGRDYDIASIEDADDARTRLTLICEEAIR